MAKDWEKRGCATALVFHGILPYLVQTAVRLPREKSRSLPLNFKKSQEKSEPLALSPILFSEDNFKTYIHTDGTINLQLVVRRICYSPHKVTDKWSSEYIQHAPQTTHCAPIFACICIWSFISTHIDILLRFLVVLCIGRLSPVRNFPSLKFNKYVYIAALRSVGSSNLQDIMCKLFCFVSVDNNIFVFYIGCVHISSIKKCLQGESVIRINKEISITNSASSEETNSI